jgi:hypothetical protein
MAGIIGILILHLILLLKLKFTAWPEMLLWPYLLIKGFLPYRDMAIAHTPLLIAKLAVFYQIFGVGIIQLKVFTWILILFTDLLLYWVSRKLWGKKVALITLAVFPLWQVFFDGNGLWFDLLLALIALILYYSIRIKKYFLAGLIFALGILFKQTFVWFFIPVLFSKIDYKRFIFGGILIAALFFLFILPLGIIPDFFNWTVNFGIFKLPGALGQVQLPGIRNLAASIFPFLIFIPLLLKKRPQNFSPLTLVLFALAGLSGAYPRFEYFHFQPAVPFLAMATGLAINKFDWKKRLNKSLMIFYILGSALLFGSFFIRNWGEGTRFFEKDVADVVLYVKAHTKPGDRIFVMNWWDNIYPLTGTLPATDPWVPQLSWYQEIPGVQEKEVSDLANSKPDLILLQDYFGTGLSSYKPKLLNDFLTDNYKISTKIGGISVYIRK